MSTLDGLVKKNRDRVSIGLATTEEVQALKTTIEDPGPGQEKDILDDWRLVALRLDASYVLRLLGDCRNDVPPWITSVVVGVDLRATLATTASGSLYRLGRAGEGEPPAEHVAQVGYALLSQGLGRMLGLLD